MVKSGIQTKPESRISLRHEALLGWFFCEGQSVFERSTFGALLERQAMLAFKTAPCGRCGGNTFTDEDLKIATARIRSIESLRRTDFAAYDEQCREMAPRCGPCSGTGWIPDGRVAAPRPLRWHCKLCAGRGADLYGSDCERCGGTGAIGGYDISHKTDEGEEPSYEPNDEALQRYAIASRQLGLVQRSTADTFGKFYGLAGLRCGAGDPRSPDEPAPGRLFAIYPDTRAGKKWLLKLPNEQQLPKHELLIGQWIIQARQPDKHRRESLEACREQAQSRYEESCRDWNRSTVGAPLIVPNGEPTRGWRDEFGELIQRIASRRSRRIEWAS